MRFIFLFKFFILFKFILAVVVFFATRNFFGAIIGFAIGTFIDNYRKLAKNGGANSSQGFSSADDAFNFYQQRATTNDFGAMMMALSAAVMKADGKVLKSELNYVKGFINQQFGSNGSSYLQVLKQYLDTNDIPLSRICYDIKLRTQDEVRVQLIHYLFGISKSDGHVSESEMSVLSSIAQLLGVSSADFETVKNMFYRNVDSDYTILGITSSAADDEVKKAYRQMAIKFHPDKVASMGEEYQKGAKEKFQKIQEAYENIKKNRGF